MTDEDQSPIVDDPHEKPLPARISPGGKGRAPYLLRCAFKAAEEGDKVEAMHYWNTAIAEGYQLKERTKKQLLFRIREGEARSRLDLKTDESRWRGSDQDPYIEVPESAIPTTEDWPNPKVHGLAARVIARKQEGPFRRAWRYGKGKPVE